MSNLLPAGSYSAIACGMKTYITHQNIKYWFAGEKCVKCINVADIVNVSDDGTAASTILGACSLDSIESVPTLSAEQQRMKDALKIAIDANTKLAKCARSNGCDDLYNELQDVNKSIKSYLFLLLTPEETREQREIDRYT